MALEKTVVIVDPSALHSSNEKVDANVQLMLYREVNRCQLQCACLVAAQLLHGTRKNFN